MIPLADIRAAADRLAGRIHRTPMLSSRSLGDRVSASVFLKAECFQKTGSFKPRGALNRILGLRAEDRARGLITVSAGNHAQAVAWASRQVQAPCAVVMPSRAPQIKVDAVRGYGGEVLFHDDNATLFERLETERAARGAVFIHPFDDPHVLAGAGTVGLEILEDLPEVDLVLVPVGGGGLLGGVASAVKQLRPATRVIAVELAEGPGLIPALEAGEPVPVARPTTLADGMIPPFVGRLPLEIAREAVDQVVTVAEASIASAMRFLAERAKLVTEGSGAAAMAALLESELRVPRDARVAVIVSGGNIDPSRLAAVLAPPPVGSDRGVC